MKLSLALAALGLAASAFAADIESGLKVGDSTAPFDVVDVSGPNKGKQLCYVWQYGTSPVVVAFVKDDPGKAARLVAAVQSLTDTHKDKNLKSFVVFTGGPELKEPLEKLAAERSIKIPMTFLPAGTGDTKYKYFKVNPEASNTILLYTGRRIKANFVNVDRAKWADVEKATASMLGG